MSTISPTSPSQYRWSFTRFVSMTEIEFTALFSEGKSLISSLLLEPIVQLVLLAAGLQGLVAGSDDFYRGYSYVAFVVPGLLALQALRGFSRTMYRTVLDRQWGMLTIKRLAGAGGAGYTASKIVAPTLALAVQCGAIIGLAVLMGIRYDPLHVIGAIVLAVVAVAFWAALAIIVTGMVQDYVMRDVIITWLMLPLSLAAPVFYTLDTAPTYLQWIARFNPLAYQVQAIRDVLLGGHIGLGGGIMVVLAVAAATAATFSVSWGDALTSEGGR